MSEVFENDIEPLEEDLSSLEDSQTEAERSGAKFTVSKPLYRLKLNYSHESIYAYADKTENIRVNDYVIIPTRYGKDMAQVMGMAKTPIGIKKQDVVTIDRKASDADIKRVQEYRAKEKEAFRIFREKAAYHQLDMKLIAAHFLAEEQKVLFFFSAENRVDFRELVKDLVSVFKTRIELRQIGVRDESRITGGLGVCGRPYCCHFVSDKLRPVSIKMAKEQNLSLNSTKVSGQCGRLLCCLAYEYDWYVEERKKLPDEGVRLDYDNTHFKITEVNPISHLITMAGQDGRIIELSSDHFYQKEGRWQIK